MFWDVRNKARYARNKGRDFERSEKGRSERAVPGLTTRNKKLLVY